MTTSLKNPIIRVCYISFGLVSLVHWRGLLLCTSYCLSGDALTAFVQCHFHVRIGSISGFASVVALLPRYVLLARCAASWVSICTQYAVGFAWGHLVSLLACPILAHSSNHTLWRNGHRFLLMYGCLYAHTCSIFHM